MKSDQRIGSNGAKVVTSVIIFRRSAAHGLLAQGPGQGCVVHLRSQLCNVGELGLLVECVAWACKFVCKVAFRAHLLYQFLAFCSDELEPATDRGWLLSLECWLRCVSSLNSSSNRLAALNDFPRLKLPELLRFIFRCYSNRGSRCGCDNAREKQPRQLLDN